MSLIMEKRFFFFFLNVRSLGKRVHLNTGEVSVFRIRVSFWQFSLILSPQQ